MGKKKKIWNRKRQLMFDKKIFLTVGYSGLSPKASGTVGSFVSLIFALVLLKFISITTLFLLSILISVMSIKYIDQYELEQNQHDSKEIVIDELVGMWITLSIANCTSTSYMIAFVSFVSFRLFDIYKPSIIGFVDQKVQGGWGVMGDDMLAGFFAGLSTSFIIYILNF